MSKYKKRNKIKADRKVKRNELNRGIIKKEREVKEVEEGVEEEYIKPEYTSVILDMIKKDGYYFDFVKTIGALAFAGRDIEDIVMVLKAKYASYCGSLCVRTFNKWVKYYPDISKAVMLNRDLCLGELVYMGMQKAEKSIDNPKDDSIFKMMDRLDNGMINPRKRINEKESLEGNKIDTKELRDEKESLDDITQQTYNTLNRIKAEASRFGGLENIEVNEGDEDYED